MIVFFFFRLLKEKKCSATKNPLKCLGCSLLWRMDALEIPFNFWGWNNKQAAKRTKRLAKYQFLLWHHKGLDLKCSFCLRWYIYLVFFCPDRQKCLSEQKKTKYIIKGWFPKLLILLNYDLTLRSTVSKQVQGRNLGAKMFVSPYWTYWTWMMWSDQMFFSFISFICLFFNQVRCFVHHSLTTLDLLPHRPTPLRMVVFNVGDQREDDTEPVAHERSSSSSRLEQQLCLAAAGHLILLYTTFQLSGFWCWQTEWKRVAAKEKAGVFHYAARWRPSESFYLNVGISLRS